MDKSIEELRAQRAIIQQHLDWMDRQIAAAESTPAESDTPQPVTPPEKEPAPAVPTPTQEPTIDTNSDEIIDPEQILRAPQPMDIAKAKIGCFVIFAVATFLFLFLLFGLPFLMD